MMKIFAVSDIHGFYDEFVEALNNAGFEKNNKNHLLVVCGDNIDRGRQPQQVLNYFASIENKVLIRGNHEQLFEECCDRGWPESHDFSNGTATSILDLGCSKSFEVDRGGWVSGINNADFKNACVIAYEKYRPFLNKMVNYYETENYIFVHSWIPTIGDGLPVYYTRNRKFEWDENWRESHYSDWEQAMWGNPFKMANQGLNKTGKTIVFGHWHCSAYWADVNSTKEFGEGSCFDIANNKEHNVVGIDACTAYSGKVNIFVVDDNLLNGDDVNA